MVKFGYLDTSMDFCMDFEFFARIASKIKVKYYPVEIAGFRVHSEQKSSTIVEVEKKEKATIINKYLKKNLFSNLSKKYYHYYYYVYKLSWLVWSGNIKYILRKGV